MNGRWRRCLSLVIVGCGLSTGLFAAPGDNPGDPAAEKDYRRLLPSVRLPRLRADLTNLAAFGSRIAGSTGESKTFDYVEQALRQLGAQKITREGFDVTVPDPDSRGELTVSGKTVSLFPLWPNLVQTSSCDLKGQLVYAGNGSLESMRGKDISGRIVLMEFNSGARWRNAAKLGAAAIIFLQPDAMPRGEAEQKFSSVPVDVPRFYLPLKDASSVLNAAITGTNVGLKCQQRWIQQKSYNLIAEFAGTAPAARAERIDVLANADSMSVVPGMSPGAEGLTGIAALLETARVFKEQPHRRPVRFVLSGAHALALRGAREFVEQRIVKGEAPFLTISLDMSSGSTSLGSYARGWFSEYRDDTTFHMQTVSRLFRSHTDLLAKVQGIAPPRLLLVDAVNNSDSRSWKNNVPGKFALDCEPMIAAGMNALTFRTTEDGREQADTPFDVLSRVQLGNIHKQTQTLVVMLNHALNDTSDRGKPSDYRIPLDPTPPQRMGLAGGFATVKGRVVIYDPQKSFIPDINVPDAIAAVLGRQKTLMGVRGDMVQATAPKSARYEFHGLLPTSGYIPGDQQDTRVAAFHIDPQTGHIDHAPTFNTPGFDAFSTDFRLTVSVRESPIVVFPCVAIRLFDLVDPQDLKALIRIRVLDAISGSWPRNFGVFSPGYDQRLNPEIEDVQVLFLSPGERFQLLGGSPVDGSRLILTNSSLGDDKGYGFNAPGSKPHGGRADLAMGGMLPFLPLEVARDITAINQTRTDKFQKYRIISPGVTELQREASAAIKEADAAVERKDWPAVDRASRAAWGYALRAHPIIMTTANDVVNGVVFYLFLLIPFSYFIERLAVGNQLLTKQLSWSIGIFIGSFLLLRLIHPAFEIVSNPAMIFIAFVMGVLSLIVISFILGKFETSMRAVKAQQTGFKEVDIRRSSVAMAAFNLGVSNMRRRKARTFLTTLTLVVMTFIVLSFTSIVSELRLDETASNNAATYPGMLMRNPGLDPMQLATYRQISNEFEGKGSVVRRAYYYGADIGDVGILSLQRADRVAEVRAMLGLDPAEVNVTHPERALLPGGRWFQPGERNVMILPLPLAEQLKITPGQVGTAKVTYAGEEYTVIGIVDVSAMRGIYDLDGDGLFPADFSLSKQYQEQKATANQAFRSFIRLDPSVVFILPAEKAMAIGADLRTVAISFNNPAQTRTSLEALMPRLRLNLYASVPESKAANAPLTVKQFSIQQANKSGGLLLILVQLAIASIFVLNTMIASVFERTKEIAIFSSIGLAPNHIAMLFFAESLVYGILGAVIGYFIAQASAKIIVATGALPGLILNFSSTSAVLSAGLVMAVVVGSTIYPARKAAQIAAPAMNDQVFDIEPEGDVWELPLPFSIGAAEAGPLSAYLTDWLRAYEGFTIGDFVSADSTLTLARVEQGTSYRVASTTWLAPYDLGVSQKMELLLAPSQIRGVYSLDLKLVRLAGDPENWTVVNQRFLANIRKQFLSWRTLTKDERAKYELAIAEIMARSESAKVEPVEPAPAM